MENGSLLNRMRVLKEEHFHFDTQIQIVARRNFKVDQERHNSWTFNERNNYIWQR